MQKTSIEIKAKCRNPDFIRQKLVEEGARFAGTDNQTDTYFNITNGRLKLREGSIENNLIYYQRPDDTSPKQSDILLYNTTSDSGLKEILSESLGVKVTVIKKRDIFFIDNVKFHLDFLEGTGHFVEIEALGMTGKDSIQELHTQCRDFMQKLGIDETDLVSGSYSDMMSK